MDDKDKVVTHTTKIEGVGVDVDVFPYHIGFYFKRKSETDTIRNCPTPHNSPVKKPEEPKKQG